MSAQDTQAPQEPRPTATAPGDEETRGRAFWIGLVVGLAVMAYGIAGLVGDAAATRPWKAAGWLVAADLLHDLVLVPLVVTAGWLVGRVVPGPLRWPVRAALVGTALTLAIGWIPFRGYGRLTDNPSLAPLDYGAGIVAVIAGVWGACALWAVLASVAARRDGRRRARARA
jgi:hypothetical protein